MTTNKNIILVCNLYPAPNSGIAKRKNGGRLSGIKLYPGQNLASDNFPIEMGTKGTIVDEVGDNAYVVRLTWKDNFKGLYSVQSVNLIIKKDVLGSFVKYLD